MSTAFAFGQNWIEYASCIDEERLNVAERSVLSLVGDVAGKSFLDVGCGSGLFSLAAHRLGAAVRSFDVDEHSVECTRAVQQRFGEGWHVDRGSILDSAFVNTLGTFDIVYSWGVLHHTGSMWLAFENAIRLVAPGGKLAIAIYNDQGWKSRVWWLVKYIYNRLPKPIARLYAHSIGTLLDAALLCRDAVRLRALSTIKSWISYKQRRGMSRMTDRIDWFGGFPFEFARLQVLVDYFAARGFDAIQSTENRSLGCHELVLVRAS